MHRTVSQLSIILLMLLLSRSVMAFTGDVTIRMNGGGSNNKVFIGQANTLEILITNNSQVAAMSLGFRITSSKPYVWIKPFGNKPLPPYIPIIQEHGDAIDKFNLPSLQATDRIDNVSPDTLLIGGTASTSAAYLPVHATSTLCYSMQFYVPSSATPGTAAFCVDNIFFPPAGSWVFQFPGGGGTIAPTFQGNANTSSSNPDAPAVCFDVVASPNQNGDVDCSGGVDISDVVYLIAFIFGSGPAPCAK